MNISSGKAFKAICTTIAIFILTPHAFSQTVEEKARGLLKKYQSTMVVVTTQSKIIAKSSEGALPGRIQQRRTLGTTISDSGLIVASNSAIDPSVGLAGQRAQLEDKLTLITSAKTEFVKVEIAYVDNTVLKGKVVYQSIDADVVFIQPDKEEANTKKFTFEKMDLNDFVVSTGVADRVVGLSRSSAIFNYMPTLTMGRITGVFEGDRVYFVNTAGNSLGIPIYTIDGKPVGITVMRVIDGNPTGIMAALSFGSVKVLAKMAEK